MAKLFHLPQAVRVDSSGSPYAGAKANFYLTGTTTRTDTYTSSALSVPHANPVVADSAGQFAAIYLDPDITYRCILTQSDDTQLDDVDPVSAPIPAADIAITDSGGYFTATEVEAALQEIGPNFARLAETETWTADQTFSGADLKMADNVVERPELKDFAITHSALTQSTGTVDLDLSTANSFSFTLTENATITLSNPPASGKFGQLTVEITQDGGGGAYTVTWPGSVTWPGGTGPTITVTNDAIDVVTLFTRDGGTTWRGNFSQAFAV
jgi:hypothetical protein